MNLNFQGPQEFYQRVMYIAPSSGHSLLIPSLPFNVVVRRSEVDVWCENDAQVFQQIDD